MRQDNQAIAKVASIKTSPQKLNLVAEVIRGMNVEKALVQLRFMKKKVACDVRQCLQSAVANAENNFNLNIDELFVSKVFVGKALVMKRVRFRARGRVGKIQKPFSNLTIVVEERKE
ncbi:MAG: 50S ribosomal protein L22 [Rickettsiales bacterium]|nr:50S ribosomal protein L22 [Rickettsiales bacterium]